MNGCVPGRWTASAFPTNGCRRVHRAIPCSSLHVKHSINVSANLLHICTHTVFCSRHRREGCCGKCMSDR
jgi:hypothetical protein